MSKNDDSSGSSDRDSQNGFAAIDLGSNSFHMIIAREQQGQLLMVDRMRESVRLAAGLDKEKRLTAEASQRALDCLARFGERIKNLPHTHVRAVGTSALRQARNGRVFLGKAARALGHPIEVISGHEEARLIYLGVSSDFADHHERKLVVDIGGGSTECIIGEGFDITLADSLHMGCVSFTLKFFRDGKFKDTSFDEAMIAAALELRSIKRRYRSVGWELAVGSSGTILAVQQVMRVNGWSKDGITRKGLNKFRKALVACKRIDKVNIPGLEADRAPVIAGGLCILLEAFNQFGIEHMKVATGALREGALYDMIGRFKHEDVRDRTVGILATRYAVDRDQASRVERSALKFLKQVTGVWKLGDTPAKQFLSWAARLHEIGLSVAYSGYHKHGGYLLTYTDLPGFSREEQQALAALVRTHRRKISDDVYGELSPEYADMVKKLSILLRLAVRLNRSRSPRALPDIDVTAYGNKVELDFPKSWLAEHPMTRTELDHEATRLDFIKVKLAYH
ncbi:MAG: exopolyphosphatase [Clostridia bacterium]|nr:exopolyphosphatase [Deltaproteobacteria bacterium]